MERLTLVLSVILVVASPAAFAQPQSGDWELSLGAAYSILDTEGAMGTEDAIGSLGSGGYFLTDSLELGLAVVGSYVLDDHEDLWTVSTEVQLKYHFLIDSDWVPYVGVLAGLHTLTNDDTETDPAVGALGGVKYFFREDLAWFAEFDYHAVLDVELFDEDVDMDVYSVLTGISFHFR